MKIYNEEPRTLRNTHTLEYLQKRVNETDFTPLEKSRGRSLTPDEKLHIIEGIAEYRDWLLTSDAEFFFKDFESSGMADELRRHGSEKDIGQ
ncbi:MAG: hypothetical protein NDJ89_18695 [Oligoflexia bacterium]|nr:hypothetical protein [Oligoflexia bacterium]